MGSSSLLTGVDGVLAGGVRPHGDVTVELVDIAGTRHRTTPRFARLVQDLLAALDAGKLVRIEVTETVVSPERAGQMLGVSRQTVYAWQDRGRLTRVDEGCGRMVPVADIERYLAWRTERVAWAGSVQAMPSPGEAALAAAQRRFASTLALASDGRPGRPRRVRRR